jgi:hypothetical protein
MYAKYKKEREGKEVLETEYGFASWCIDGEVCYIEDIFVDLYHRQSGLAAKMADDICRLAKDRGCKTLLGSVNVQTQGSTTSMKVLLAYGMKLRSVNGQMIYLTKEI